MAGALRARPASPWCPPPASCGFWLSSYAHMWASPHSSLPTATLPASLSSSRRCSFLSLLFFFIVLWLPHCPFPPLLWLALTLSAVFLYSHHTCISFIYFFCCWYPHSEFFFSNILVASWAKDLRRGICVLKNVAANLPHRPDGLYCGGIWSCHLALVWVSALRLLDKWPESPLHSPLKLGGVCWWWDMRYRLTESGYIISCVVAKRILICGGDLIINNYKHVAV